MAPAAKIVFHSPEHVGFRFLSLRQSIPAKYSLPPRQGAKIPNKHGPSRTKLCHCGPPAETQNSLSPAVFLQTSGLRGFQYGFHN